MPSAAQILREARVTAGLTQSQLAARASSSQSVVSAYEGSRREPSLRTLVRLVGAAGLRLDICISARTEASSRLRRTLDDNADELKASLGALGARSIRLIGSVARGDATETSDIDLLVELDEGARLSDLARLRHEAERILQAPVDVVPTASLQTRARRRALDDAIPL